MLSSPQRLPVDSTYVPTKQRDAKEMALLEVKNPEALGSGKRALPRVGPGPLANPTGEYQQPGHISPLGISEKQRVRTAFLKQPESIFYIC